MLANKKINKTNKQKTHRPLPPPNVSFEIQSQFVPHVKIFTQQSTCQVYFFFFTCAHKWVIYALGWVSSVCNCRNWSYRCLLATLVSQGGAPECWQQTGSCLQTLHSSHHINVGRLSHLIRPSFNIVSTLPSCLGCYRLVARTAYNCVA